MQQMTVVALPQVLSQLSSAGIAMRIATKKLAAEEAPESYKDVSQVGPAQWDCILAGSQHALVTNLL